MLLNAPIVVLFSADEQIFVNRENIVHTHVISHADHIHIAFCIRIAHPFIL